MSQPFYPIMSELLVRSPLLLAYVIALVICAMRWNRSPRPAQMAFLGTAFLLIASVGEPLVMMWILTRLQLNSSAQVNQMLSMTHVVASVTQGTGFLFLVGAVFIGRRQTDPRTAFPMATPHSRTA